MERFIQSINEIYKIRDGALLELTSRLKPKEMAKKTMLIEPCCKDRNVYFIEKGVARAFVRKDGKEVTSWIGKEGQLLYSTNSYYGLTKGYENERVQMLENSLLYYISIDELERLCTEDIDIANWLRVLYKNAYLEIERRLINRYYMSAEERYKEFELENKDLFQRVNLGYIASYLGMSHVTLCALRKKEFFL